MFWAGACSRQVRSVLEKASLRHREGRPWLNAYNEARTAVRFMKLGLAAFDVCKEQGASEVREPRRTAAEVDCLQAWVSFISWSRAHIQAAYGSGRQTREACPWLIPCTTTKFAPTWKLSMR